MTNCINLLRVGAWGGGSFRTINMDIDFGFKYVIHRDGYVNWAIKLRNVMALGFFIMAVTITRAEYCGCLQQMKRVHYR